MYRLHSFVTSWSENREHHWYKDSHAGHLRFHSELCIRLLDNERGGRSRSRSRIRIIIIIIIIIMIMVMIMIMIIIIHHHDHHHHDHRHHLPHHYQC